MTSHSSTAEYHKIRNIGFSQRTADVHARHILPYIKPHHRILDIGCGPGSITVDLAALVPEGQVVGMDINADSIQTAKSLAEAKGIRNVSFVVGDVKKDLTNFEPDSFDIVHAHQLLLHLTDPLETMKQMRRIVKPGGFISTVDSAMQTIYPPLPGVISSNEAYRRLSKLRGADPNFGLRHHVVANEAGFGWGEMEFGSWSFPELGREEKRRLVDGARKVAAMFVEEGIIGTEEAEEQIKGWEEWGVLEEGRMVEVASVLVCWKR